jgi:multidrug efflux system outer membrane protein
VTGAKVLGRWLTKFYMRSIQVLRSGVLGLVLTGCAVGPNYHAPTTAPKLPVFAGGSSTNYAPGDIDQLWWKSFNDSGLSGLVDQALAHNQDLKIAGANLREARALRRQAVFDLFPTVTSSGGFNKSLSSTAALPSTPRSARGAEFYDLGFDATWELDIFGRVRRSVEAGTAALQAAEASLRDVQISLIGEVARNYFELRGAQNELDVARRNAENQRETLKITQARLEGGRGTELDTARARGQLSSTLAIIPALEMVVAHSIHRLGTLTGQAPSALREELSKPGPLPGLPPLVNIGTPENLLRRRPDVRAAERNLASVTARIGIVTADLFPRVAFNGRVALEARTLSGLADSGADAWSFGPRITWAALDLGRVRARINAADARAEAALGGYERTVLLVLEETENALVDYGHEQARRDFLQESVRANETAARIARQRFENGATDFLTVLDAERVMLEAQDQLAQSQTRTATALVALYKALGGGWENTPLPAAALKPQATRNN